MVTVTFAVSLPPLRDNFKFPSPCGIQQTKCLSEMEHVASSFALMALSEDVLCAIIKGWLRIDDIGKLDSAHCCHNFRPSFIHIIKHLGTAFDIAPDLKLSRVRVFTFLDWLNDRRLRILNWRLDLPFIQHDSKLPDHTRYSSLHAHVMELNCYDACCPYFRLALPCFVNLRVLTIHQSALPIDIAALVSLHCPQLRRIGWYCFTAPYDNTVLENSRMPVKYLMEHCQALEEIVIHDVCFKQERCFGALQQAKRCSL